MLLQLLYVATLVPCLLAGRFQRALEKSREKPQDVKWLEKFMGRGSSRWHLGDRPAAVELITEITLTRLDGCLPVLLYDYKLGEELGNQVMDSLASQNVLSVMHGNLAQNGRPENPLLLQQLGTRCSAYVLLLSDVTESAKVLGSQVDSRVMVLTASSQWRVLRFLASDTSRLVVNLLVATRSDVAITTNAQEPPYILYTHELYVDGLGSSEPRVLTSWMKGALARPKVSLFPTKMAKGFAGHRFIISVAHQPPFVVKKMRSSDDEPVFDGVEVRLIRTLAKAFNFTTDFREAANVDSLGSGDAVAKEVSSGMSSIGLAGLFTTSERIEKLDISPMHSQDCAAFISRGSTALPRYRAIMGPFHWTVWLALTVVYLIAIFPLAFSDRHTISHLIEEPQEMENMFWYVFGTFTNCFSFSGKKSWTKSEKVATRMLIGWYWVFTIIITACYTGSIIAFVTLPVFPETVDTVRQLASARYRIGTLDRGGWQYWFTNSTDSASEDLLKNIEFLPSIEAGIRNTTRAFFWNYAFLGSRAELDFVVRTNYTPTSKRSVLHISSECFVPYSISLAYPKNSVYQSHLNRGVMTAFQFGLLKKIRNDFEWDIMRSATGKFLQANTGGSTRRIADLDRALTLDDTQGMFLLLGIGFAGGAAALASETACRCFCGCWIRSKEKTKERNAQPGKEEEAEATAAVTVMASAPPDPRIMLETPAESNALDDDISELFNFESFFGESNANSVSVREKVNVDVCSNDSSMMGSTVETLSNDEVVR